MPFPVSERDVEAAEAALGARFPTALRVRLMRDNGGEVETGNDDFELFKVLDTSDPVRQARTAARDIVRENQAARDWRGFPPTAVAIGDNGAGDMLVLLREGSTFGDGAFVWDHATCDINEVGAVSDLLG